MEAGKLRLSKYSVAYRNRLIEGGLAVQRFLQSQGLSGKNLLECKASQLDVILEQFVSNCHTNRTRKKRDLQIAKHGVLFFQVLRPRLKQRLKQTWATLKAWEELQPSQVRSPIPIALLMGMLCRARINSEIATSRIESRKWMIFSVLVSLGFFGVLRPGELLALRKRDITLPNNISLSLPCITIGLERPKNFRQLGARQFTSVYHIPTCEWTAWLCSTLEKPEEPLWPTTANEFRKFFRDCGRQLNFTRGRYTPASLRAGGATFLFDEMQDVGRLRFLGRWANIQSLEHYIQSAKANMQMQELSTKAIRKVTLLLKEGNFLLKLPSHMLKQMPSEHRLDDTGFVEDGPIWRSCRVWGGSAKTI